MADDTTWADFNTGFGWEICFNSGVPEASGYNSSGNNFLASFNENLRSLQCNLASLLVMECLLAKCSSKWLFWLNARVQNLHWKGL